MLELSGARVVRGDRTVLAADLTVGPGERLALLGPSGAGKSTLLAAIAGLLPLAAGSVRIAGRVVSEAGFTAAPHERGVGMVFQTAALWPHLSVREHLAIPLAGRPDAARVTALAAQLELAPLLERLPHELSGGEARRVALGRALAAGPALLLLDEPLAAVDALARPALSRLIADAAARATILYVTHDPAEAASVCPRAAIVEAGRVAQVGTWDELARTPATPLVARFAALARGDRDGR